MPVYRSSGACEAEDLAQQYRGEASFPPGCFGHKMLAHSPRFCGYTRSAEADPIGAGICNVKSHWSAWAYPVSLPTLRQAPCTARSGR